jgi:cell division protein FtsL
MSENVNFNKQVYDKNQYTKVIDTSFKQLGVQTIQEQITAQPNTNEFFAMYNDLFYNIPELGETNSHEYLIKTSSEYIGLQANQEEITALQAEIAQLRTDLLDAQKQVIELQTGTILQTGTTLANPQ